MTRRLALRRFPDEVIRRRQGPAGFNFYGEPEPGAIVTAVLPARVEPLKLEDADFVGGVQLVERLRVFVPTGVERVVGNGDVLAWGGDDLLWNGSPLQWGGFTGYIAGDQNPLAAAFDDRGADEVEISGAVFVVEESALWRDAYCRAVVLRET